MIEQALRQNVFFSTGREQDSEPWRFMLLGPVGAGKTTLVRALEHKDPTLTRKTQMIDYAGWGIDTPGEYIERGTLRRVLVSAAFDAMLLVVVQDATAVDCNIPPNYFLMFPQHTIGVVTKLDDPRADAARATDYLRNAGVTGKIFYVSAFTGQGIPELRDYLLGFKV